VHREEKRWVHKRADIEVCTSGGVAEESCGVCRGRAPGGTGVTRSLADAFDGLPKPSDVINTCLDTPIADPVIRGIMESRRLSTRQPPTGQKTSIKNLEHQLPTDADLGLLCSFQEDLHGEQTYGQLRKGLVAAGFRAPLARYLIRSSEILHRVSRNRYILRRYDSFLSSADGSDDLAKSHHQALRME